MHALERVLGPENARLHCFEGNFLYRNDVSFRASPKLNFHPIFTVCRA
jgi:hypothetical protein